MTVRQYEQYRKVKMSSSMKKDLLNCYSEFIKNLRLKVKLPKPKISRLSKPLSLLQKVRNAIGKNKVYRSPLYPQQLMHCHSSKKLFMNPELLRIHFSRPLTFIDDAIWLFSKNYSKIHFYFDRQEKTERKSHLWKSELLFLWNAYTKHTF